MDNKEPQNIDCCCCGPKPVDILDPDISRQIDTYWISGKIATSVGEVPRVRTAPDRRDKIGAWKVRWGIGRMTYMIPPGLYAVGSPTPESPVFVTANYKMSFDRLRAGLAGIDGWLLVLDTRGVNVWCSAGKGTFGTDELVVRIKAVGLGKVVSHRRLILPQLSATGVCAHEVKKRSGFRVFFGPVRAGDIKAFIENGFKAQPAMRQVTFKAGERLALAPIEIVGYARYALPVAAVLFVLSGLGGDGFDFCRMLSLGPANALMIVAAWIPGAVVTPLLLPWLPGRSFSGKGAVTGLLIMVLPVLIFWGKPQIFPGWLALAAWLLIIPAIASFLAMNFTGSSTYTSLSGVKKEMRIAIPLQIGAAVSGFVLWIAGLFVEI